MTGTLVISVELGHHDAVLSLDGELDATTISSLVQCLACLDHDVRTIALDLNDLSRIDARSIHVLVGLRDEMALRFQHLECRNVNGDPALMLQMAGVAPSLGLD